jgi:NADH-quinone oxidoreductase subunit J
MNLNAESDPQKNIWMKVIGVVTGGLLLWVLVSAVRSAGEMTAREALLKKGDIGLIQNLGKILFTD